MDVTIFGTALAAFLLYLNTLNADFAYDDSRAVQKNQDLVPDTPLINVFYDDFWGTPLTHTGSHKSYRPLCVLTFRLNYMFGELNPWGYHLGNVILHTIVTAIFTKLSRVFLKQTFPTLVSGLIFASHPVHVEAVAGIVGRADVGACLFFILALFSYMEYTELRDGPQQGSRSQCYLYFGATAALTTASMLTKEQGVTVLGVCAAFDLFVHNKMKFSQIIKFYKQPEDRRAMEGVFLLFLLGVALVSFRVYFMGNQPPEFAPSDNPASDSDSFVTRLLTFLLLPALNMWLLLCPRTLSFDWSMSAIPLVENVWDYRNIFTLIFYSALAYTAYHIIYFIHNKPTVREKSHMNGNGYSSASYHASSKHSPNKSKSFQGQRHFTFHQEHSSGSLPECSSTIFTSTHSINVLVFSIALLVFPFIPATNLFFYVGFVMAERVLYIPSMGFCLLVGYGAQVLFSVVKDSVNKQKLVSLAVLLLVALNGGRTVVRNVDWATEENLYSSGIATNPAKAWGNLANIYNSQGKLKEAENAYRSALTHRPNMGDTHYNLGILLQAQKRYKEAMESYQTAISCRPNMSMAYLNLGILLADTGAKQEAEVTYRRCADLDTQKLKDPRLHAETKISCLYNLGRLYSDQARYQEALAVFEEAVRRRPDHYASQSLYNMYGEVYYLMKRYDEAEHWYRKALRVKPDHIPAHLTMAKLFQAKGQMKDAESMFLKAQKIDPTDVPMIQHYAQFLGETGRLTESAALYSDVIDKDPDNFNAIFNGANILRQVERNAEAEKLFERAAQLKPDEASAHMNLGAMYHLNGKVKEAEKSYKRALELKPDDQLTKDNLKKLQRMRG